MKLLQKDGKKKFLLVEIGGEGEATTGVLISLNDEREISFEKVFPKISAEELARKKKARLLRYPVILSVNSSHVLSVTIPLNLNRESERAGNLINAVEIETLLAQKMLALFREHRAHISRTLGVHEFDVALVDAKVKNFELDGKKVLTPVGLRGNVIHTILELTFTTRDIFESWKEFLSSAEGFFFTETARAGLFALNKILKPPLRLFSFEPRKTLFFVLEKDELGTLLYRSQIAWESFRILDGVGERYGTEMGVSKELYDMHLTEKMSPALTKGVRETMEREFVLLEGLLGEKDVKGVAYADSARAIMFPLPLRVGKMILTEPPLEEILQASHMKLKSKNGLSEHELFHILAPFIEFYYDRGDTIINRSLKKRIHWLIT